MDVTTRSPATHPTRVFLLYDDRNLYVGFIADQRGVPITATQRTDGVGCGIDDFVGIGIDTTGNGSLVYFFETTPRGVRYQQSSENVRYRPHWIARAHVGDGVWSAVIVIPLRDLRFPATSVQSWRIDFFRSIAATARHQTWAYDGLMHDGPACAGWPDTYEARFWPTWSGMRVHPAAGTNTPRGRLALYGLESIGRDRTIFEQSDGSFAAQPIRHAGADFSIPLAQTINLVGTIAPDFSNVETDQFSQQPREFQQVFQEYRPFFAQGAAFLSPDVAAPGPDEVFYSPSIGAFDAGVKAEGTFGDQQFGVLNFTGTNPVSGERFDDTAFGYRHATQDHTFMYWADGVLARHSIAGSDTTVQVGAFGRNLHTGFVWGFDHALERGSWVASGFARESNAFLDVHKANYEANVGYVDLSPAYDPLDGYTADADIRGFQGFLSANGATRGVENFAWFLNLDRFLDASGAVHQSDVDLGLQARLRGGISLDGVGPSVGTLRSYGIPAGPGCGGPIVATTSFSGYPCYRNGTTLRYQLMSVPLGYGDGTPHPLDVSASWGPYGGSYVHLYMIATSRTIAHGIGVALEYDGSLERDLAAGTLSSQWLRRITVSDAIGPHTSLGLSLRGVNGLGGFVPFAGTNLSASFHREYPSGDLFLDFGTPAAPVTLDRLIIKYVVRIGAAEGT